MLSKLIGFI